MSSFSVVVLPSQGDAAPLVAGLTAGERTRRALADEDVRRAAGPDVALLLTSDALVEPAAIRVLVGAATRGTVAMAAGDDVTRPAALALAAADLPGKPHADARAMAALAAAARADGSLAAVAVGDALCTRIGDAAAARRAGAVLLGRLVRPTDGFFARHFDRHLSRRLSVRLVELGVAPNVITVAATAVGLLGAALLAGAERWSRVAGAVLFVTSTILDGCDGEVARLSFRCSEFGHRLDLVGDNLVNAAVFVGLGVALVHGADGGVPLAALYLTIAGFLVATTTGFLFSNWLARDGRTLSRNAYERLTGRDFAYVILALAPIGRLHWFLWLSAVGCWAFAAGVLGYWAWLRRRPLALPSSVPAGVSSRATDAAAP